MTPTKAMPRVEERKRALAAKVTTLQTMSKTRAAGTNRASSSVLALLSSRGEVLGASVEWLVRSDQAQALERIVA